VNEDRPEKAKTEETGREIRRRLLAGLAVATVLCAAGFLGADLRLGALAGRLLSLAPGVSAGVSHVPDLLLPFTAVLVLLCWTAHLWLLRSGRPEPWSALTLRAGISLPIAFGTKSVLKFVFGRVNARVWLAAPHLYGLHWFHGGGDFAGFPSGHMAVFTPIGLALAWAFPKWRRLFFAALVLLALALLVTDYHFLSDVAAGTYVGIASDAAAVWLAGRWEARSSRQAAR
jgi:membrane-associated phospholipid phosphatase